MEQLKNLAWTVKPSVKEIGVDQIRKRQLKVLIKNIINLEGIIISLLFSYMPGVLCNVSKVSMIHFMMYLCLFMQYLIGNLFTGGLTFMTTH